MLSILTSVPSLSASRYLDGAQLRLQRAVARLSSGQRINSALDDAAGLAISSRMQAQSQALGMDVRNLNDLASLVQVADGALGTIGENLQRIRVLAVQAANSINGQEERQALQDEALELIDASRRIQATTEFNGRSLLNGSFQVQTASSGIALRIAPLFQPKVTNRLFRYAQMTQASTTVTPTAALASGDLVINRHTVGPSTAGSQVGQSSDSAWAIAGAINQAAIKDITAQANATVVTGSSGVLPNGGNVLAGDIVINGVPVRAGYITNAINGISGQTGVTARLVAGQPLPGPPVQIPYTLVLTASDGRNIDVAGAGAFGVSDTHAVGSVTLTGPLAERPAADLDITGANPANAGFSTGSIAAVDSGDPVYVPLDESAGYDLSPDFSSTDAAQATIGVMDRKLDSLLKLRATLGAAQNVLGTKERYLLTSLESTVAANSRITDADYAIEVAQMSKETILQRAGMAMSAQANAEARWILMLLVKDRNEQRIP